MGSNSEWELFIRDMWSGLRALEWPQPPDAAERAGSNIPSMNVDSVSGVEVGTELATGDTPLKRILNIPEPVGGNPLLLPVRDSLLGDAEPLGQPRLRPRLRLVGKGVGEGLGADVSGLPGDQGRAGDSASTLGHSASLIPRRLYKHKPHLIAPGRGSQDDAVIMADIPRPENFYSFQSWISAVLQVSGITQAKIAHALGCSQQAVGHWKAGGKIKPAMAKKLAQFTGTDPVAVIALVNDQPLPTNRKAKLEASLKRHPEVERIASMLDLIAGDAEALRLARSLIQELVAQRRHVSKAKNE